MKVLFVVNEKADSGIRVYSNIVAKELRKHKIKVNIDCKYGEKYDLIHIHSCRPENIAKVKLYQPRTPIVTSTHMTSGEVQGLVPDMVLSMLDFGLSAFYSSCNKIFVNSNHLLCELKKNKLLKDKLILLPYPLDKKRFPKVSKKEIETFKKKFKIKNKKTILCVASIQYRKGIFEFAQIAKELPEYNFVWVGDVPNLPYLKNKNEINNLIHKDKPDNLIFTKNLFGKDLACAYSTCDLFWLPSFSETFGLVIIEAASFGKPVLIRDIYVKKLFFEFINIYSTNPKTKIIKLLEKPENKTKLKEKIKKSLNKFSLDEHTSKLISEYKKVIKN